MEGAYQYGTFGSSEISAWGFYGDLSKHFESFEFAPRLGLRAHFASGDKNLNEPTFRTFAAPYPPASEITATSTISVSNTENLQPYLQFHFPHEVTAGGSWNWVRRATTADSVYGPVGTIITAPGSQALVVAQVGELDLSWNVTRFFQLQALYAHTFAGDYIVAAKGRDFDYYRLRATLRF